MKTESMVEGRWPKYENEIALGVSAAESLEKNAGDTVIVRNGEEEASYLVTGIYQTMNNMGMMVYCTTDAFERIGSLPDEMSTYVNLKKGYTFDDFEIKLIRYSWKYASIVSNNNRSNFISSNTAIF